MSLRICPNCRRKIRYLQFLKYTRWHPISCDSCGKAYHIETKHLGITLIPLLLIAVVTVLVLSTLPSFVGGYLQLVALVFCIILLSVAMFRCFRLLKNMSLVERKVTQQN